MYVKLLKYNIAFFINLFCIFPFKQINDVDVLRVTRRGADAIHFTPTPFDVDQEVQLTVDWTRRWDNMQQHSGTRLFQRQFNIYLSHRLQCRPGS